MPHNTRENYICLFVWALTALSAQIGMVWYGILEFNVPPLDTV